MRAKVTVVGAGNVGATCAQEIARRDYADVVLVDIIPNLPQGKALDLNQAGSVLGHGPKITGANGYSVTGRSSVRSVMCARGCAGLNASLTASRMSGVVALSWGPEWSSSPAER